MLKISYAGCLNWSCLPAVISTLFAVEMRRSPKSQKKSQNALFWWFKVVQGHRCLYPRKARQQCVLW